jgi:hypothetical protein
METPGPAPDSFAASVRRTLARVRQHVPERAPPAPPPKPAAEPTPGPSTVRDRRRTIKCRACGRSIALSADELRQLARATWPMCCNRIMLPVADPDLADVAPPAPKSDRRGTVRRLARAAACVEIRRGLTGTNPNLALKLVDVSDDGIQVLLKERMRAWEVVEVALAPAAAGGAVRGPAIVCWCVPTPTGQFRAGLQLRHRLTADDIAMLGE